MPPSRWRRASDRDRQPLTSRAAAGPIEVVIVLEVLSPSNKRQGSGRQMYLDKRRQILETRTNLVEIDLLRAGERMPVLGAPEDDGYRALISRGRLRPRSTLLTLSACEPIPCFHLPLHAGDEEPEVDLRSCLDKVYAEGGFDLTLDYATPLIPPLHAEEALFADRALRAAGVLSEDPRRAPQPSALIQADAP